MNSPKLQFLPLNVLSGHQAALHQQTLKPVKHHPKKLVSKDYALSKKEKVMLVVHPQMLKIHGQREHTASDWPIPTSSIQAHFEQISCERKRATQKTHT